MHRVVKNRRRIVDLSLAPGKPSVRLRKSRLLRVLDLVYIALRWDEYSTAYYAQRGDEVGVSVSRDLVTIGAFNASRGAWNRNQAYPSMDYSAIFGDKLVFERYFGSQDLPVVKSFGILFPGARYFRFSDNSYVDLRSNDLPIEFQDAFCKPLAGTYGKGAFRIQSDGNVSMISGDSDGRAGRLDVDVAYLIQERVLQHSSLARFHEPSLNTLRLVSFIEESGDAHVAAGFLRMGVEGAVVDNASAGGVICGFDVETGVLYDIGYRCGKQCFTPISEHPTSGLTFGSYQLPWFKEALDMVRKAHALAPWIKSIGWDVAITENGPLLVEGNDWWGPLSLMWIDEDFISSSMDVFSS